MDKKDAVIKALREYWQAFENAERVDLVPVVHGRWIERESGTEDKEKGTKSMKDDMISRRAAIDALYHVDEYNGRSVEVIRNLPSAQPEIIRCKDCRHNHNCDIQYHAQAGDMFFCAGAERRTE